MTFLGQYLFSKGLKVYARIRTEKLRPDILRELAIDHHKFIIGRVEKISGSDGYWIKFSKRGNKYTMNVEENDLQPIELSTWLLGELEFKILGTTGILEINDKLLQVDIEEDKTVISVLVKDEPIFYFEGNYKNIAYLQMATRLCGLELDMTKLLPFIPNQTEEED